MTGVIEHAVRFCRISFEKPSVPQLMACRYVEWPITVVHTMFWQVSGIDLLPFLSHQHVLVIIFRSPAVRTCCYVRCL